MFVSADKPPIEELHQFLEFQLPRQWAPVFGELALGPDRKQHTGPSLQFSLMGPKLYVNTTPVMLFYGFFIFFWYGFILLTFTGSLSFSLFFSFFFPSRQSHFPLITLEVEFTWQLLVFLLRTWIGKIHLTRGK